MRKAPNSRIALVNSKKIVVWFLIFANAGVLALMGAIWYWLIGMDANIAHDLIREDINHGFGSMAFLSSILPPAQGSLFLLGVARMRPISCLIILLISGVIGTFISFIWLGPAGGLGFSLGNGLTGCILYLIADMLKINDKRSS